MESIRNDFAKAIGRLEEALRQEKNEITRDSAILRYGLCFDLAWKTIKVFAKTQGLECYSPKSCIQSAFQMGLIDYNELWLQMIEDRNLIVHTYAERTAERVFSHLQKYTTLFKSLAEKLSSF